MFYRDRTRAAPTAQPIVDLVAADGEALDALTVYVMRYKHICERIDCGATVSLEDAPKQRLSESSRLLVPNMTAGRNPRVG